MKKDTKNSLDFPKEKVEVLGAPVCDYLFNKQGLLSKDNFFLKNHYHYADLCLSVISSSMKESIFCNTPALNFIYGRWKLLGREIDIKDYKLHYLEHLYSYGLIKHVYSVEELIKKLKQIRKLRFKGNESKKMLEGEIPLYRGFVEKKYAEYILRLCEIES